MSDEFRPLNPPKCECFDFDKDYDFALESYSRVVDVCSMVMALIIKWECERVVKGLEKRILENIRHNYKAANAIKAKQH